MKFRRVTIKYFIPGSTWASWQPLALVVALTVLCATSVRIDVLISFAQNGFYTALQEYSPATFYRYLGIFGIIAFFYVVEAMVEYYVGQCLVIRWRVWLNGNMVDDWLDHHAYHCGQFVTSPVDNPDQRIQEDIDTFTNDSQTLAFGAIKAVVSLYAFTLVLWELSAPFTLFGVAIPRAMTLITYLYVIIASIFAFKIGRPLIRLNFLKEGFTASFRYALVRIRDNTESVSFSRGEDTEKRILTTRFGSVIANAWSIVYRSVRFQAFNLVIGQISVVFAFILEAPRFFAKVITLGDIQQAAIALAAVHDALSFFRNNYDTFAAYRATVERLAGLREVNGHARALPCLRIDEQPQGLTIGHLTVNSPTGARLITALDLELKPGDSLLVKGASGAGKTTLLRAIAGLWPYSEGTVVRPTGPQAMFLPQQPYLPIGSLRHALAYPREPTALDDDRISTVLEDVHLAHLIDDLAEDRHWSRTLSPGEQQRIGVARVLISTPKIVFLDESTSALGEGFERSIYKTLHNHLSTCITISVGHRSTLNPLHNHHLQLHPGGRWDLTRPAPTQRVYIANRH